MIDVYKIREMQEADIDRVMEIEGQNFIDPWCRQAFEECIYYNDCLVLEVVSDTTHIPNPLSLSPMIIGFLIGTGVFEDYSIYNIAIDNQYQRQGIGTYFLQSIIKLHKGKYDTYLLECRKSNTTAISFYTKFGFTLVYERKDYYQNPIENALVLRLNI